MWHLVYTVLQLHLVFQQRVQHLESQTSGKRVIVVIIDMNYIYCCMAVRLEMGGGGEGSKERYQKDDQEKEAVHYTPDITSRIKRPIWSDEENKPPRKARRAPPPARKKRGTGYEASGWPACII